MIPERCAYCDTYCSGSCSLARASVARERGDAMRTMNAILDRPHKYAVGNLVRHRDAEDREENYAEVYALTLRLVELRGGGIIAYPTYVLHAAYTGEVMNDILDNADLVKA